MKIRMLFATLAALMGACGGNPPNQSDTSVMPSPDSGTPAADAGQSDSPTPVDAAVDTDAPVVPEDTQSPADVQRDAEMNIPGIGPVIMTGAFQCSTRLCRDQQVTLSNGVTDTEPRRVTCNMAMTEAELSAIGFSGGDGWATCRGNSCFMPMGGSLLRAIVYPMTNETECGLCGVVVDIDTSTGMEIPRTSSVRQSCPL